MRATVLVAALGGSMLSACVSPGEDRIVATASAPVVVSEAQALYDVCTPHHNNVFGGLSGPKAIVAGLNGATSDCFWVWGARNTATARRDARANCQAMMTTCQVY